jgi:hypothetical protein
MRKLKVAFCNLVNMPKTLRGTLPSETLASCPQLKKCCAPLLQAMYVSQIYSALLHFPSFCIHTADYWTISFINVNLFKCANNINDNKVVITCHMLFGNDIATEI